MQVAKGSSLWAGDFWATSALHCVTCLKKMKLTLESTKAVQPPWSGTRDFNISEDSISDCQRSSIYLERKAEEKQRHNTVRSAIA